MAKIIVTGSLGFIGSHLVDRLIVGGSEVLGIDDLSGGDLGNASSGSNHFIAGCETEKCKAMVERFKPDILYYLAADAREGRSQFTPVAVTKDGAWAYINTLTAAIRSGVKRVVLFSSMSVYGDQEPPFNEKMNCRPVDVYGVNKATQERMTEILAYVHGFEYVILRPHNVVGIRQRMVDPYRNVIAIWMNRIMQGKPPIIYGDGEQKRAFTMIQNILPCIVTAGFDKDVSGEIINIGPDKEYTINQACDMVLRAMGSNLRPEYHPDRPVEVKNAWCTVKKSKEILGYEDTVSLEDGIMEMAKWAKGIGPKPFIYLKELEIVNDKVPETWLKKTL